MGIPIIQGGFELMLHTHFKYTDAKASVGIGRALKKLMNQYDYKYIVVVCIGTDRCTGDALGPLVGSVLKKAGVPVIGTLAEPVHATNLTETVKHIPEDTLVIAVDACLGKLKHVGSIDIIEGALQPGKAVGKNLPDVGDISICGVVNVDGFTSNIVLQTTRLHLVNEMANCIAKGIRSAISRKLRFSLKEVAMSGN